MAVKSKQISERKKGKAGVTGSDTRLIIVLVSALLLAILIIAAVMWTSA
jgi:hypothetical protein